MFYFGVLGALFGGRLSPPKPPRGQCRIQTKTFWGQIFWT